MSTDGGSPSEKSGRRKRNNVGKVEKAAAGKSRKPAKQAAADAIVQAETERPVIALPVPKEADAVPMVPAAPALPTVSEAPAPVPVEALAKHYAAYLETSAQQVKSFCEQFARTTSVGKAIELHTDFVKQGLDTFVESSQNIRELHRQIVRRELTNLQRCVASFVQAALEPAIRN